MKVDARLRRLEEQTSIANRPPTRALLLFVHPDPNVGIVSVGAIEQGSRQLRKVRGMEGESVEELKQRAARAMGWA
jgi:hypothetical protein